jgi:5-methylcytosine-specific restriction endonuclease McrA
VRVPGASRAARRGERADNPLRLRGVVECLDRRGCVWQVARETQRTARRRRAAAARRPNLRAAVFERDSGVCVDCGERHPGWQADHVMPLRDGGRHAMINMATRCPADHRSKTAREARERSRRVRWELA